MGNNGGDWQTINWSKIRRITKAKAGEHFHLRSYHIIGQNKIKTGQTLVSKYKHWH